MVNIRINSDWQIRWAPLPAGYAERSAARRSEWSTEMSISKQEYYEGAALHLLACTVRTISIQYEPPFFILNGRLAVYLKYSTRGRSPWGFTFTPNEQILLQEKSTRSTIVIGLICGADGIATIAYNDYFTIAALCKTAVHIACYRKHGEHYEIKGPDGGLSHKVAPSNWEKILTQEGS